MSSAIHANVPEGITIDNLQRDIDMLLSKGFVTIEELREVMLAINSVTVALERLEMLTEKHMPHKTAGHCNGLGIGGPNRLLSMLFDIQRTTIQFTGGISLVTKRVEKILAGKEQFGLFDQGMQK